MAMDENKMLRFDKLAKRRRSSSLRRCWRRIMSMLTVVMLCALVAYLYRDRVADLFQDVKTQGELTAAP
jgi:hypothetical protein